jgi:uncharacterized membrane protein
MHVLKLFIIALACLFITDTIWLRFIAKGLYFEAYQDWFRLENNQLQVITWAAILVYLLLASSLIIFVLPLSHGSILAAILYGAAMGCITYGIFDFTCLAIFKNWPLFISFIDWAWGTCLCAFSAGVTAYLARLVE